MSAPEGPEAPTAPDGPTPPVHGPGVVSTVAVPSSALGAAGPPKGALRRSRIERLGPHTRSVVVPVILVVVALVAGFVALAVVLLASTADVRGSLDLTPGQCRARAAQVERAVTDYRVAEHRNPERMSDLVPDYLDEPSSTHVLDTRVSPPRAVPVAGLGCDVDDEGAAEGSEAEDAEQDRERTELTELALAQIDEHGLLLMAGSIAVLPFYSMLGWWMTRAYRGVLRSRRRFSLFAAYRPAIVAAVAMVVTTGATLLAEAHIDEVGTAAALLGWMQVGFSLALGWAMLSWLRMLEQVNHSFGRTSWAPRLARAMFVWVFSQPLIVIVALMAVFLGSAGRVVFLVVLIQTLLALTLGLLTLIVSFVAALILATVGIERAMGEVAGELTRLEGAGWLAADERARKP